MKINSLSSCPVKECAVPPNPRTVVVGGPPALISSANETNVLYVNDSRQIPIADGSAFHLEFDSPSEAPTGFKPTQFMAQQIYRALFVPETLASAESTGFFSWRSLDWIAWIQHPEMWVEGIRLAWEFQQATSAPAEERGAVLQSCADRCKANQKFYLELDEAMQHKLLNPLNFGSIIIARDAGRACDVEWVCVGSNGY